MSKKTICFFNSSKTWGGGEKWHHDMALGINGPEFAAFVMAGKNSELSRRLENAGLAFKTLAVSNISFLNPIKLYQTYRILKTANIHTIIINLSEDLKIAGPAAKLAGIKYIIYRRGSAIPVKNSFTNRFLFRHVLTGIIANSEQTKKTILANNPELFPEEKITVIYNGINMVRPDTDDFKPVYKRQEGEIILGNAGRLVRQKGQQYLIEAARLLKKNHLKFKILIAGDGPLKDDLQKKASAAGVSAEIIFLGFVDNIRNFMKSIDIFLLTSLWEGFGYVLVEAMAEAKPVVAFDVSSNPEIVENKKTGYLVEKGDIPDFVKKIQFLSEEARYRTTMGIDGKRKALSDFRIEQTVRHLKHLLRNV